MKKKFYVLYYEDKEQKCYIQDFIDSKSLKNQAKIMSFIELLEDRGPNLPRPYADLLEDGIHELRIKISGNQTRILYFFCYKNFIILTHAFLKNTKKVPKSEIQKAKKFRDDFIKRYSKKALEDIIEDIINESI